MHFRFAQLKHLTLWLVLLLVLVRSFSGLIIIESSIERVELMTKQCLPIDDECVHHQDHVHLGEAPSHELNWGQHLLADNIHTLTLALVTPCPTDFCEFFKSLPLSGPQESIDHPPKA